MKFFIIGLLFSQMTMANFKSPFPSTVKGVTIPNTHYVGSSRVLRGMAPAGKIHELLDIGVTDVLIFKNETRTEVTDELVALEDEKSNWFNVHHIPFLWKDITDYKKACVQTVKALKILKEVKDSNDRKIFFHCTVGEDRTGMLSGLWRMLNNKWKARNAFKYEMCENGYASGNPDKPSFVAGAINRDLTPLFKTMASLIKKQRLTVDNLDITACDDYYDRYIQNEADKFGQKELICQKSSRYPIIH